LRRGGIGRDWAEVAAADQIYRAMYSLRWLLIHLVEEYARHCGQADLIRQAIDGATGG